MKLSYSCIPTVRRHQERIALVLVTAIAAVFTVFLNARLTDAPNTGDAVWNLRAAYNCAYRGVFSFGRDVVILKPSDYREPLPIITLAAYIRLHPELSQDLTLEKLNQGSQLVALKQHNVIWAFLCLVGVASVALMAVRPPLVGMIAAIPALSLTYLLFLQQDEVINRTLTELEAATLLIWCSFALIRALQTGRSAWFAVAGALLGALALTKAMFLYVGLGLVVALLVIYLARPVWGRWRTVVLMALMLVSMGVVVMPWMVRNALEFGSFEIAQRGGLMLIMRAYFDKMNNIEYRGAFYKFTPFLKTQIGDSLGFSPSDLEIGGRLQRLNLHNPTSFYQEGRRERARLREYFVADGEEHFDNLADSELQREALSLILRDPMQHIKTSALLMWRGMWSMGDRGTLNIWSILINAVAFAVIWVMALTGVLRQNAVMIGIGLLPTGSILFLALTTEFIPRYSAPMVPSLIIALTVWAAWTIPSSICLIRSAPGWFPADWRAAFAKLPPIRK